MHVHSRTLSANGIITIAIALLLICACRESKQEPPLKPDGSKWRVAYVEGGQWRNYHELFCGLVWGLKEKGYFAEDALEMKVTDCPESEELWDQLVETQPSPYLHFLKDGYYSAEWMDEKRAKIKSELTRRLQNGEVDLLLAMGTWSGVDFATNEHSVPTMVLSASEPVTAGIVKDDKYSGIPHVHATHDPTRYLRQIRSFHEIVQFDSIGVVFEDTPEGRS
ncbi:MAG: hypothetical protein ACOC2L_04235 [Candidatus Sumerlaeota bacterium]